MSDPLGRSTLYEHSALTQVTKIVHALGVQTTFTYDPNGNLLTLADARRVVHLQRQRGRCDLDRPQGTGYGVALRHPGPSGVHRVRPHGSPPTYGYSSTIATTYDEGDRATVVVDSVAGTIDLLYDAGRRTSMQVAGQTAVTYAYDNADRLTRITQGAATVAIGYDTAGRRTSLTLPNGILTRRYKTRCPLFSTFRPRPYVFCRQTKERRPCV